jgi:hypothetical protein
VLFHGRKGNAKSLSYLLLLKPPFTAKQKNAALLWRKLVNQ